MATTTRAHATLRIGMDRGGSAAEITGRLGLTPTRAHEVGDPHSQRDPRPWNRALWALESDLSEDHELDEHLNRLCDLVDAKAEELHRLTDEGYRLDWFCLVEIADQAGVTLAPDLLRRMARLPVALDLDIYGYDVRGGDSDSEPED